MLKSASSIAESYERDGYSSPITVMSAAEARDLRKRVEKFETDYGKQGKDVLYTDPHFCVPFLYDLSLNAKILDAVEAVIGPDILCWSTGFFIKDAHDSHFISWHQDLRYWGLEGGEEVTAWLAFSPSTTESGCVRVVPGSHKWGLVEHKDTEMGINMLSRGQYIPAICDEDGVDLELHPGQVSLHHGLTAHASQPNRSDGRRIGFTIRYITPDNRPRTEIPHWAHLCRGEDRYRNFIDVPRPEAEMKPDDLQAWSNKHTTMEPLFMEGMENA